MKLMSAPETRTVEDWRKLITECWFRDVGAKADPVTAARNWDVFTEKLLGKRQLPGLPLSTAERSRRYLLAVVTGVDEATVRNYLKNNHKLSDSTRLHLQIVDEKLGFTPVGDAVSSEPVTHRKRGIHRIALATELTNLPSTNFHQNVIRSILIAANQRNFSLMIHEVHRATLTKDVRRLVLTHECDGLILIRLTPDDALCSFLAEQYTPVVAVHADVENYSSPPVLANISPVQTNLGALVRDHVVKCLSGVNQPKVVIVHMPFEDEPGSIRDERIRVIKEALSSPELSFNLSLVEVSDYGFNRAFEVFSRHPEARLLRLSVQ